MHENYREQGNISHHEQVHLVQGLESSFNMIKERHEHRICTKAYLIIMRVHLMVLQRQNRNDRLQIDQ